MRRRAEGRGGAGRTNLVRDCRERRSSKQALGRLSLPPSVVVFPSSRARPGPLFSLCNGLRLPWGLSLACLLPCLVGGEERSGASWRGEKVVDPSPSYLVA